MRSRGALLRAGAVTSVAALVLHQLRFAIGYGLDSPEATAGHGYLPLAAALATGLLMLVTLQFVVLVIRARDRGAAAPPFRVSWLAASALLLAIFVGQELLEGLLAGGQGAEGLFAHAGWSAIPLAVVLGALVALVLHGAERALATAGSSVPRRRHAAPKARVPRSRAGRPRASVLSRHLASRAPPVAS